MTWRVSPRLTSDDVVARGSAGAFRDANGDYRSRRAAPQLSARWPPRNPAPTITRFATAPSRAPTAYRLSRRSLYRVGRTGQPRQGWLQLVVEPLQVFAERFHR